MAEHRETASNQKTPGQPEKDRAIFFTVAHLPELISRFPEG